MSRRLALLAAMTLCALAACSGSGHTGPGTSAGAAPAAVGTSPIAHTATTLNADRLLPALNALHQYAATSGEFQVLVQIPASTSSVLPSFITGSDSYFVGDGTVDVSVDFNSLTAADLQISPDGYAVAVKLPHAQLSAPTVDTPKSYVLGTQQGVNDLFGSSPEARYPFLVAASDKIRAAATKSGLAATAETDTTAMLTAALHTAGFTMITVRYGS